MAIEGTVNIFGKPVKKQTVYFAGAFALAATGVLIIRQRQARKTAPASASGTSAGTVTDPAGNTCAAVNPATGFCPGTQEDQAAQQSMTQPYNTSGLGGGLGGYYYGPGGSGPQQPPGPGGFADNAEWTQYVINYMTQTLHANGAKLGEALGLYIEGHAVDEDQRQLIEEAIAIGDKPPDAGPGGYPPSIRLESSHKKPPKKPPAKVTVPNVVGDTYDGAADKLKADNLTAEPATRPPGQSPLHVTAQNPRAAAKVDPGTKVHLTLSTKRG